MQNFDVILFNITEERMNIQINIHIYKWTNGKTIKLQAMQDAPPLQLYPASDKFLM